MINAMSVLWVEICTATLPPLPIIRNTWCIECFILRNLHSLIPLFRYIFIFLLPLFKIRCPVPTSSISLFITDSTSTHSIITKRAYIGASSKAVIPISVIHTSAIVVVIVIAAMSLSVITTSLLRK